MNKSELVSAIASNADISKAAAERALSAFTEAVTAAIAKGDSVTLIGFGTFKLAKRAARVGKNPQTGAEIKIPASNIMRFAQGAAVKAKLNKTRGK